MVSIIPACPRSTRALVYCSITGFGQDGPYAPRAGYDFIIQGMSGMMDLTGEPDGAPQKIGVAMADITTGLYSVIAIQAALHQRNATGRGQHIDMALARHDGRRPRQSGRELFRERRLARRASATRI